MGSAPGDGRFDGRPHNPARTAPGAGPAGAQRTILLVEDNAADARLLREALFDAQGAFQLESVPRLSAALDRVALGGVDAVLLDLSLPDSHGMETLTRLRAAASHLPVIVLTHADDDTLAAQALRQGAQDYLVKGEVDGNLLVRSLRYAIERKRVEEENVRLLQREQAARADAEAARRVQDVLESMRDAFISLDTGWRFTYLNPRAEALLRRRRDELIGRNLWDEFPALVNSPFYTHYYEALTEGVPAEFEAAHPPDDAWLEVRAYPSPSGLSVYFHDATARKQAFDEGRFQARLLDAVGQAVVASDLRGNIIYWNGFAETLYGYSAEEAQGRSVIELTVPPGEARGDRSALLRRLRLGETVTDETAAWRRDGTRFLAFITHSPVFSVNGELIGVVSVSSDVTERRRAEQQVRRQNGYLATLHETTLAVMNRLDLNNLLETIAARAAGLLGAQRGELYLLEPNGEQMLPAAAAGGAAGPASAVVRGVGLEGRVWETGESLAIDDYQTWPGRDPRLAGAPVYAAVSAPLRSAGATAGVLTLIHSEPGPTFTADEVGILAQFAQLASVALDNARLHLAAQSELNERKRSEKALRQAESRYRGIFENALEGIYQTGFDGHLQTANQSAARILGYGSPEELMTQLTSLRELHADPDRLEEFDRQIHRNGAVTDFDFPARNRDGRLLWLSTNAHALRGANGRIIGVEGMLVDITERRLAERRLATQNAVARILAAAGSLDAATPPLLQALAEHQGWDRAQLWQPDAARGLVCTACWCEPEVAAGCPLPAAGTDAPVDPAALRAWTDGRAVWTDGVGDRPTVAVAPVRAGTEVVAVLHVTGRASRHFNPALLDVLSAAAAQVGQFIERVRAEQALQARARQQAALADLSQRAVADSNTDALMERMAALVAETVQVDLAGVLRLLPDGASLALRASWPQAALGSVKVSAGPETQAGLTLLTNAPVAVDDLAAEQRFSTTYERGLGVVSSLSVPVGGRRRPFGVLVAYSSTRRTFSGDDIFFMESAAGVLAAAADRRRAEQDRQFLLAHAQEARAEAEAAQERMTNVLETTSDAFLMLDPSWRLLYLNPQAEQLLRRERRDLLGRNLWEEFRDLPAELFTRLGEALATGNPASVEQFYAATGSWLDVRAYPSAAGMSVFFQDITERKQADAALEESARVNLAQKIELEGILRQLDDGLMLAGADGRVRLLNPAARAILGLSGDGAAPGEPEHVYWQAVSADGTATPAADLPLARALAGERGPARDITALVHGEQRIISVSAAALTTQEGARHGAVAVLRDVTDVRRVQDREMETERLRALGEMASGVAHNFNNLLAIILLRCDLLEKLNDESPLAQAAGAHVTVIKQVTIDGRETVNRLQALSGVSKSAPHQAMHIGALVRDVIEFTRPRWRDAAQQHGITINATAEVEPLPALQGSPAELREVLINLIFNAVDAMPCGGDIHVTAARHVAGDTDEVVLRVRDSGEGMPDAVRRRVFEPFFSTKGPKGVGLGLSMSRKLIANMGGQIGVESKPGEGAAFWITLPYRPALAAEEPAAPATLRPLAILLVDDQPHMLETTALMLEAEGHTVITAESGAQALERIDQRAAARGGPFDVVVTDLGMPGMNGLQLVAAIREDGFDMPCVLATGWGVEISDADVEAGGVQAVLAKPYSAAQLRAVLATVTGAVAASV